METIKKYVRGNQATGFWGGYYHVKVNAEKKKK